MRKITFIAQHDQMDCGPSCLSMVSSYYGKHFQLNVLRDKCFITKEGVSLLGINEGAKAVGFETFPAHVNINDLQNEDLPCILHWNQNHFVVLYKITKNWFSKYPSYVLADPAHGIISLHQNKFLKSWSSSNQDGIALFLKPTDLFYAQKSEKKSEVSIKALLKYLTPFKKQIGWLFLLLLLGTFTTFIFPILTQKLIDEGVTKKDLGVITYILLAQLSLFLGNIMIDIFRNWIMLTLGTRINIQIISDFLRKILKLPINFFETKMLGDFYQRIQDHERIEQFLTSQSLLAFFSTITFTVFFGILWYYDYRILLIYIAFTSIAIGWSIYWLKKRKLLDYLKFQQRSENQESVYEILNGVAELKLNQFENHKLEEWEIKQEKLFNVYLRMLKIDQIQLSGFEFFNQIKNILVTFLAAFLVVNNEMTLGALLSVSYIIGQMNSPVNQLITFFRSLQDAKLSFARLTDTQNHRDEEQQNQLHLNTNKSAITNGIELANLSFQYEGPKSPFILKDITLNIPYGQVTAIVGASGSGKTTLLKLLLRFYTPTSGHITFNQDDILQLSPKSIRQNCGVVMQDGFIFSDTIERNIATQDKKINLKKLEQAIQIANLNDYIDSLPLGLKTKIGAAGNGISGGQKQRILIARSVYRNPNYIFFDEATSALDAENEKIIHDNLQYFFKGKTVIIIAHRLSTVKKADQIIVLKQGEVVEIGNHESLVSLKKDYYNLVKNQLELGN
ncbi:peptidase domain-containing ABC transporter [Myroides odoratus]|uniref:Peptidase domain-containing ABC transporter n=1 Tax=Myroides odoratus TaxID=256 RepID=A0A9Q6ZAM2_MYROD|nr:peptidase domain-containing ABC transporter [Myroides odoratus]EHQ41401.1 ABC transporter related protein [Myroides odoratus DSM 2801]EKB08728.1 hypothetical protein HMPREF9716_00779 [Myroides odoratus CIP 103059]QQT98835.1 peptidase domain-containing ABC transporter [Myroides odoratus]WQD58981.1 peptidase domain-containing ABC transporter [Myroides odoratus]STZ32440.1 RTX-I toxin determinant B [Myroides odoratus]